MSDFGARVRKQRKAEDLTQTELAEKVGVSRSYISEIERGTVENISHFVVDKIQKILGFGDKNEEALPRGLPRGLEEFAEEENLPERDIEMLASIELRGKRPETKQEWKTLYSLIRAYLENKD